MASSVSNAGLAQSDHPYKSNIDQEWVITNPDVSAKSSKIHFSRIDLAYGDVIEVLDASGTVIQTFADQPHLNDLWSDYVPGRIIKIRFRTSSSSQDWGFRVDEIESKS